MPVKTIAMPRSSAAAITSSSRIEPPGWITAVAPASRRPAGRRGRGRRRRRPRPSRSVSGSGPPALAASPPCMAAMRARVDAAHLAGADADGRAVLGVDDGVRLHVLGHAPGEQQVGELLRRSARAWSRPSGPAADAGRCRGSGPGSRRPRVCTVIARCCRVGQRAGQQQAQVLLGGEDLRALRRRRRARSPPRRRCSAIASAVAASSGRLRATMPPKAETRIALQRAAR